MSSEESEVTSDTHARDASTGIANSSIVKNLRIVSLCTLLSRLLGLGRDIAMASLFGAGTVLDVFIVAFRLPNLTRQLFGEGALTTAFLPVYLREQTERGPAAARATLTAVAIALASFLSLLVLVGEAAIFWGLMNGHFSDSTVLLLQLLAIMLPYMVFICSAALLSAALHALRIFLWPALIPVVLNVLWLTGVGVALLLTEDEQTQVRLVAGAIVAAGVVQCLLPFFVLQRLNMGLTRNWRSGWPRVHEVIMTMLPVVAGISVIQFNAILDSLMAWGLAAPDGGGLAPLEAFGIPALLPAGTATTLYIGQRLYQFPLGVFGIALGTVLYPLLTQHAQKGELGLLRDDLCKGIRLTIAIALPSSAGLFVLAEPLTNLLFRHGQFTAEDSSLTAQMIATYGAGVWTAIGLTVLNRAFYATGDRITPMKFGVIALLMNFLLNILFVIPFQGVGLALGSICATTLQLAITTWKMNIQLGPFDWALVLRTLWKTIVATTLMVLVCLVILKNLSGGEQITTYALQLMIPFVGSVLCYWLSARWLGMSEIDEIFLREKKT